MLLRRLGAAPAIGVLRATPGLGDLLCATPMLRALRRAVPEARIVLLARPWVRPHGPRLSLLVDEVVAVPALPGLPDAPPEPRAVPTFLAAVQRRELDLALQAHGSGAVTNIYAGLLGARRVAGHHPPGQHVPDPELSLPYPEGEREVELLLRLVEHLGAPRAGDHLEWPVHPLERRAAARLARASRYAVVHPGASDPRRAWPAERYAALAAALAADGLAVLVTGGEAERALATRVATGSRSLAVRSVAGRTGLGELGALLAGAALVVVNDTGVAHLARAVGAPSATVVTRPDLSARWLPRDPAPGRLVLPRADGEVALDDVLGACAALVAAAPGRAVR